MARFNPETQAEGQNYLGYSRGQEADDSLGILFKGMANVAEGAGKVADDHIQNNIREEVTREYDATNDSFGIDAYGVAGGSTTGPGTSTPPEIEQAKGWLGKVSNAFRNGDIKESHYAARLEQRVKDLRNRYPGYREQIDDIVADVTGMTPANVLRQQLFNEFDAERKALADKASDEEKLINGWLDGGELNPALGELWTSGDRSPELVRAIKNDVLNNSYSRAEITSETGKLSLRKAQKEDVRDDADRMLGRVVSEVTNNVMKAGYDRMNFNRDEFMDQLTKAGEDFILTDEEIGPITQQLNMGEAAALAAYDEAIHKPWDEDGNNFNNSSNPDAIKKGREDILARFAHMRDMITNKDTGLLKMDAAMTEARQNRNMRQLFEQHPEFEKAQTLKNAAGAEIYNFIMLEKTGAAMAVAAHGFLTGAQMNGEIASPAEAFEKAKEIGIKDPKSYNDLLDAQITIMTNEKADVTSKEEAMNRMYGDENSEFIMQIKPDQQVAAYQKLTDPKITAAIVATNNPDIQLKYLQWQSDTFQNIFQQKADDIHQTFTAAGDEAEIVLDPDTGQLEVEYTGEVKPGESIRDAKARQETYQLQLKSGVEELNGFLKNFKNTTDALGKDFVPEARSLFLGLDMEVEIDSGEDTSEELTPAEDADLSNRDLMVDGLEDIADVDLETPEEQTALFGEVSDEDLEGYGGGDDLEASAQMLREFEGFRERPYWDVNAQRVGYGSDTITREDGSVVRVTKGMKVSREDAERDLKRRIGEFQNVAKRQVGNIWNEIPSNVKAALTSVTYNYGKLPKVVANAVKTGEPKKIASAILKLRNHNGGVNRVRRTKEARIVLAGL